MVNTEHASLTNLYHRFWEKGSELFEKKEPFQAILYFARSLAIAELLEDTVLTIKATAEIANVQFKSKNFREAHQLYTDLVSDRSALPEMDYINYQNRLGIVKMRMGHYQDAAEIFDEIARHENPLAQRKALNNRGVLYYHLHTFFEEECMDKAIQCFKQAYDLSADDRLMQHKCLRNMGIGFYEKKDYTTALRKFKESILLSDDKVELATTLNELAKVYIELHDFDQAASNLREAEKILLNKNFRNLEELSRNIYVRGLLAKKMNRTETAFSHFQTALQGFVEKEIYSEAALVCKEIYEMFKKSNPERASYYLDQYQFYLNYLDPMDS